MSDVSCDRNTDLPAQLRVAVRDDEAHEVIHLLVEMRLVLEPHDVMRCKKVGRGEQARTRDGAIGRDGPALKIRASALLDEAEEVTTQPIDGRWLEDRLDRLRDRDDKLLDLRA